MDYIIHVDEPVSDRLGQAATARRISVEQLIATAAEWFLTDQDAYEHTWSDADVAAMHQAQAQFARGEGVPHEQVLTEARERLLRH